ncbi:aldo/keto reductase [Gordonia sp. zg691]|uniref:aldo/keto reductase n=1 Tax=Gordonia jinghuaiqii TaxID=2758710 RepID=UPI00166253CE|nr:aldo/keto reductase [Gordonia jinghuaiqii]MBD0863653.1 aldo/keto reductase [Gordonia jinghuaiqii]
MHPRTLTIAGSEVPTIGQGTWRMGEDPQREVVALRAGIDLGLTLLDTAEMYAEGRAEQVVAEATRGRRDDVFIVSKVHPDNAATADTIRACENSLSRLETDRIDLYLLHWRLDTPLEETILAFDQLVSDGKIRAWGVSNFDIGDLDDLPDGNAPAADQILYNLVTRGPEAELMPRCADEGIAVMAYTPVDKGALLEHPILAALAADRGVSPAQVALAWSIRDGNTVAIPKALSLNHIEDNAAALDLDLTAEELAVLDGAFPAPGVVPLETGS